MIPGKVVEQLILETVSRYTRNKKVIWCSQQGFTMWKPFLNNLITVSDEMTGLVDERSAVNKVYLYFSK